MGRQIRFFMAPEDEYEFLKTMFELELIILDRQAEQIASSDTKTIEGLSFYITFKNSNIVKTSYGFVDAIGSEVIQCSPNIVKQNGSIRNGRLWVEHKYYDSNQELVEKSIELKKVYDLLSKWIRKNYKLSTCKMFYIGKKAYELYRDGKYRMEAGPQWFIDFN